MYIESQAYASNLRQKMVCGSVLVALHTEYFEWYHPALVPGQHYVQVSEGCRGRAGGGRGEAMFVRHAHPPPPPPLPP